jgi:hypothetical protein
MNETEDLNEETCPSPEELRKMPPEERDRILDAQAALAEPLYRGDPNLTDFEAFELEEQYLDGDACAAEAG